MKTKLVAYGSFVLLFVTLLVAYVPSSAAQGEGQLTIRNEPVRVDESGLNGGRLPPESGKVDVPIKFTVDMPPTTGVCPLGTVTVTFALKKPDYAPAAVVSPSAVTQKQDTQQETTLTGFDTVLTIVTTRKAPAFQTGEYAVTATAVSSGGSSSGCVAKNSLPLVVPITIINDYFPIMEYQPARYIQKTGQNKDVVFSVKMTNFGNGDTRVNSQIIPVSKNKLDAVIPPSQTTLESKSVAGEKAQFTKEVVVTGRTPHSNGYTNSIYTFSVQFDATSVQTGQDIAKDTQTLTLSVQVQGVYVPGFDPAGAIAALGVALVLIGMVRRRRSA